MMYWSAFFVVLLVGFFLEIVRGRRFRRFLLVGLASAVILAVPIIADFYWQTYDKEIWSGNVTSVDHKEEWDEYHPASTTCTTDRDGNETCRTKSAYWEHHKAENSIHTTDDGWIKVNNPVAGGHAFNDSYPNRDDELESYFPIGSPSASIHHYVNRLNASYSIFKNKNIDLHLYPDLPEYPDDVYGYIHIPRIVGDVPDKDEAVAYLNEINSELNKQVPDPDNPGETKVWKEVNLIFVNLGADKPREYGLALQDKWKNGNKNDFVVSFSMDSGGQVNWVYAFSWSEVDILKLEVQDLMLEMGTITGFTDVIAPVAEKVADQFVRKSFSDFDYLQIEPSRVALTIIWVLELGLIVLHCFLVFKPRATVRGRGFLRRKNGSYES